jgi:tRNA-specific adenosine deaminase 1
MESKVRDLVSRASEDLNKLRKDDKWSVYSALIISDEQLNFKKTFSIGSGIKCSPEIDVKDHPEQLVHDCHAEILCKRAFNCFLLHQLSFCKSNGLLGNEYIEFNCENNMWRLKQGDKLIFYTSCSPCNIIIVKNLL